MANQETELNQVKLLLIGDRKTISIFTDTYGQFMYNVCYKILQSTPDAEEATQDSVLKVLKNLHSFDIKSSLKAWCYTIAYRTAIDYKRRTRSTVELKDDSYFVSDKQADVIVEEDDRKKNVSKMIQSLDEESRTIVTIFYLEERNIKEVMKITGLTESNIKIKLFRARKHMAEFAYKKTLHLHN